MIRYSRGQLRGDTGEKRNTGEILEHWEILDIETLGRYWGLYTGRYWGLHTGIYWGLHTGIY